MRNGSSRGDGRARRQGPKGKHQDTDEVVTEW